MLILLSIVMVLVVLDKKCFCVSVFGWILVGVLGVLIDIAERGSLFLTLMSLMLISTGVLGL